MKTPSLPIKVPAPPKRGLSTALASLERLNTEAKQEVVAANVAPLKAATPNNAAKPSEEKLKDFNFKVSDAFHMEFKTTAVIRRMTMKELIEACFAAWKEKHGGIDKDLIE